MTNNTGLKVVQPYLFFSGRCEEALNFYKTAIGAEVSPIMRFEDSPDPQGRAQAKDLKHIMHASFKVGQSEIMVSDGCSDGAPKFEGFSLSIAVPTEAEADRIFEGLSQGGNVMMPMGKTFFAPRFGMVTDKFGVGWMVIVIPAGAAGHK